MQDVLAVEVFDGRDSLTHELLSPFFVEWPDLIEPEGNGFIKGRRCECCAGVRRYGT